METFVAIIAIVATLAVLWYVAKEIAKGLDNWQ